MSAPADDLAQAVERVLPDWVVRCVAARLPEPEPSARVLDQARRAGAEAAVEVGAALRDLGGRTPLEVVRAAVAFPTRVLAHAGVAPVERDEFSKDRFPDDVYDLTPANWADVDESLNEPFYRWMAARVVEHKTAHG